MLRVGGAAPVAGKQNLMALAQCLDTCFRNLSDGGEQGGVFGHLLQIFRRLPELRCDDFG